MFPLARAVLCAAVLSVHSVSLAWAETGFKQLTVDDLRGRRPLEVALWYPTDRVEEGGRQLVGDNPAFVGIPVVTDAPPQPGAHPLIVLSHGHGGNWRNQIWLAETLVAEGYVVAAPNHPGTTSRDRDPVEAHRLWERPRDLSRIIDQLEHDPTLGGRIDGERIAVIGHSLGGWTAMALLGAHFDPVLFREACGRFPEMTSSCRVGNGHSELGLDGNSEKAFQTEKTLDPRVRAGVILDLGLAQGFTPESLAGLSAPLLVISAGDPRFGLPVALESGYLLRHLPASTAQGVTLPDAGHFSFLSSCKEGGQALLEEEVPGDGIICEDGGGRSRQDLHAEVRERVRTFLAGVFYPDGAAAAR